MDWRPIETAPEDVREMAEWLALNQRIGSHVCSIMTTYEGETVVLYWDNDTSRITEWLVLPPHVRLA